MPAETDPPTSEALAKDLRQVRSRPERAFNIGALLGLTLAVASLIFLVQNSRSTRFEWLWLDFTVPLWAALLGALVVGAVLVLTALAVHLRRRRRVGRRDRAAGRLEQALVGHDPAAPRSGGRPAAPGPPPEGAEARPPASPRPRGPMQP